VGEPAAERVQVEARRALTHAEISTTLSSDGRKVVFYSDASNLPGGSSFLSYVRNIRTGKTTLVSRTPSGDVFDINAASPAISADGRYVPPGAVQRHKGAAGINQIWVRDLRKGTTRVVSRSNTGKPAHDQCFASSISANGRFIVFQSRADNLPGSDGLDYVYLRDMKSRQDDPDQPDSQGQACVRRGRHPGDFVQRQARRIPFARP
jgi:Tol biopolymer transport system component